MNVTWNLSMEKMLYICQNNYVQNMLFPQPIIIWTEVAFNLWSDLRISGIRSLYSEYLWVRGIMIRIWQPCWLFYSVNTIHINTENILHYLSIWVFTLFHPHYYDISIYVKGYCSSRIIFSIVALLLSSVQLSSDQTYYIKGQCQMSMC